jgi:hypothetical protein
MSLAIVARSTLEPTHRRVDVRATIEELRRSHPRAGEDRLAERLAGRLEEDRHLLADAARSLVRHFSARIEGREHQRRAANAPVRARREAVNRREVKATVTKARRTILLDMPMPNGKPMRFCTGDEMASFGTAYAKKGEPVGDAMVGEILVEVQVRELLYDVGRSSVGNQSCLVSRHSSSL